ncbi:hypothetical protein [Acinetobacter ursingii]|uniref:hypothetical protein n=1 Tax=Acinetobacter ursingii TaxID=108980 RepID=UPI000CBFC7D2|nr:hypothetical protein CJ183_14015 [Acinetobacter ursingii]
MKKLGIALIILLTGCATVGKFEARMEAKKGLTKEQLIDEMGIPVKEYKSENFEIVEYYQSDRINVPQSSVSTVSGGTVYTNTSGGSFAVDCKLEFKLIDGIVTNYRYKGSLCRSN